jgi:calcineurin-like phosphoesterase family protein
VTIWFTSDTHFGHENIIGYCGRPFSCAAEMDETLVERWNAVVKPSDHVYHLGDVAMRRPQLQIVKRLNGHKRLIFGNHDIFDYKDYVAVGFKKLMALRVLDGILFSHIPIHEASLGRFRANVHGHTHEKPDYGPRYLNLCVERTAYAPVSLESLQARIPVRELATISPGEGR